MYVYDITFQFKTDPSDFEYFLISYLCTLSGNNQIIFETLNISGNEKYRVARVSVPYMDSLNEKYYDSYTREAHDRLAQHLESPINIRYVARDFTYSDDVTDGKECESYVLCIHPHLRDFSPICSGQNRKNIPYYLFPKLSEETVKELTSWDTVYTAYDQLFYATGIGEQSAHRMMSNPKSRLNQKGSAVCKMLENELKKPVYYYLYRFYGKQPKKCPLCGGEWKKPEDSLFDYKCDICKIAADKTPNE